MQHALWFFRHARSPTNPTGAIFLVLIFVDTIYQGETTAECAAEGLGVYRISKPRRIIHCSDGIVEEFSEDENDYEVNAAKLQEPPVDPVILIVNLLFNAKKIMCLAVGLFSCGIKLRNCCISMIDYKWGSNEPLVVITCKPSFKLLIA
jgi:hypothetical protein